MADEGTECTDAEMNTPAYVRNEEVDEESSHLLSWDEWLREHASQLLLFARQQSRSPEDAEDILQDALVRLARKEASGEFVRAGGVAFLCLCLHPASGGGLWPQIRPPPEKGG